MLLDFFLERARIEDAGGGLTYSGHVPDLPEIHVRAASFEECRAKLAQAISDLLAFEAGRGPRPDAPATSGVSGNEQTVRHVSPGASDIIYEKRDWIARVTINRPEAYNAYTTTTLREMADAFRDAAQDKSIAALVLTGAGDKAFCSGGDVKQHSEEHLDRPEEARAWVSALVQAHGALRDLGKPTVARINGIVAGGGNGLNLACDLAIAADHAKFVILETKFGTVTANGVAQWLPLVIGERRAREMMLTGQPVSANKALLWGLVNDVVPYKELDGAVDGLCMKLIDSFPESVKFTRQQLNFWKNMSWDATVEQVTDWLSSHFASRESREGLQALADRREIDYRGYRLREVARADAEGKLPRACAACGASEFPASFAYCGLCGARLGRNDEV